MSNTTYKQMTLKMSQFACPTMGDLSRGKHNPESKAAFRKVKANLPNQRMIVLRTIDTCDGATMKRVAQTMGKFPHQISGRITELKKLGMVETTGFKIDGSALLQLTPKGREQL